MLDNLENTKSIALDIFKKNEVFEYLKKEFPSQKDIKIMYTGGSLGKLFEFSRSTPSRTSVILSKVDVDIFVFKKKNYSEDVNLVNFNAELAPHYIKSFTTLSSLIKTYYKHQHDCEINITIFEVDETVFDKDFETFFREFLYNFDMNYSQVAIEIDLENESLSTVYYTDHFKEFASYRNLYAVNISGVLNALRIMAVDKFFDHVGSKPCNLKTNLNILLYSLYSWKKKHTVPLKSFLRVEESATSTFLAPFKVSEIRSDRCDIEMSESWLNTIGRQISLIAFPEILKKRNRFLEISIDGKYVSSHLISCAVVDYRLVMGEINQHKFLHIAHQLSDLELIEFCRLLYKYPYILQKKQYDPKRIIRYVKLFYKHTLPLITYPFTLIELFDACEYISNSLNVNIDTLIGLVESKVINISQKVASGNNIAQVLQDEFLRYRKEQTRPLVDREPIKIHLKEHDLYAEELVTKEALQKEGIDMKHCVGGYGDQVQDQNSIILKIYSTEDPSIRYTAEYNIPNRRIVQIQGRGNTSVKQSHIGKLHQLFARLKPKLYEISNTVTDTRHEPEYQQRIQFEDADIMVREHPVISSINRIFEDV